MKTLVIKSSEWLRAIGMNEEGKVIFSGKALCSGLLIDKHYCCLGLDARRCGFSDEILNEHSTPNDLTEIRTYNSEIDDYIVEGVKLEGSQKEYSERWVVGRGSATSSSPTGAAMLINDDSTTTDEEKIALLRPIFLDKGIEIDWRPNE